MSNPADYSAALQAAHTPRYVLKLTRYAALLFFLLPLAMLPLPWQQNITALGSVVALSPNERPQTVDAPVNGIIEKWHVGEGSKVRQGDVLLEIRDVDPLYKERLAAQREANASKLEAKQQELASYEVQLQNLIAARNARISAAQYRLDNARQKALVAAETVASAQATLDTAEFQQQRLKRLLDEGLVSQRELEVAERDRTIALRSLNSAKASREAIQAEVNSTAAEINEIRAETQAALHATNATLNKIRGEIADSRNSLAEADINLSRQQAQIVTAPRDGTVFRLPVNSQSRLIKQGQPLLEIVPDTSTPAAALMVDGLHAPLITPGREVRLEFEGWPAIQFSGWPSVALGTFGGRVAFVDATDNGTGAFRVLVVPDPERPAWPADRFLRQGVSVKGWILLEEVSLGYEIWRRLNGFPPRLSQPPAGYTLPGQGTN